MARLNEWCEDIHRNAQEHGWYAEKRSFGDIVALCHSELSEALEAHRNGEPLFHVVDGKPEGEATEMVDCVIRIMDWFGSGAAGVDMETVLRAKFLYNKGRPWRHGGKRL